MLITALSKEQFDLFLISKGVHSHNVWELEKIFFISILSTDENEKSLLVHNRVNVLIQRFDNVGEGQPGAMTPEQAKEMQEFIYHCNPHREACLIHCNSGLSRGNAVALFITQILKGKHEMYKVPQPQLEPNLHVLKSLKNAYANDGRITKDFMIEYTIKGSVNILPLRQKVTAWDIQSAIEMFKRSDTYKIGNERICIRAVDVVVSEIST